MAPARKAIILGAAGRDFHNFNVFFRDHPGYEVAAFTAAQIPYIEHRTYPAFLAGPRYPEGIPIFPENELPGLIRRYGVQDVFFAYSDVRHEQVMHLASLTFACGASFHLLGPDDTMIKAGKPVIAVVAARTGAGKSTVTRYLRAALAAAGLKAVAVRHPMPYGRFERAVERYATTEDVTGAGITVEEMEEYQQHVDEGGVVFAGVDYGMVLQRAEAEGDVILWDGGNNDMAFYRPDLTIVVLDPLRPGDEAGYFPGEANVRAADIIVINKVNAASGADVERARAAAQALNPAAPVVLMASQATLDLPELVRGKNVLVVEDGPSVTHGGLPEAVGAWAARRLGANLVDPRPYAVGSLREVYEKYPQMGAVLPALGYSAGQLEELRLSIDRVPCDAVVLGTPANLAVVVGIAKPVARVRFVAEDVSHPTLQALVLERIKVTGGAA
ncbi:MAG: GTPase [Gammaproteobacteria bacterium]|nr:GTPase [Gammaproteobacteria bacterium]